MDEVMPVVCVCQGVPLEGVIALMNWTNCL